MDDKETNEADSVTRPREDDCSHGGLMRDELRIAAKVLRSVHASIIQEPWWKRWQYDQTIIANLALSFDLEADEIDANNKGQTQEDAK